LRVSVTGPAPSLNRLRQSIEKGHAPKRSVARESATKGDGFLPYCGPMIAAMKIIGAIFALALLTIAFGTYSDYALTRNQISQTSTPDTATVAVAAGLKRK
jgi:hypothetical protein